MTQTNTSTRKPDALDDLFAYDASLDDVFDTGNARDNSHRRPNENLDGDLGTRKNLGIDDEIVIRKKRAPIAKLDTARLLSAKGIMKLRHTAKRGMRFRGKGHEFSDVQRLLSMYQLWLDDLYPRAKFLDGLALIEKLGHNRHIQVMRKEWINEGKPKRSDDDEEAEDYGNPPEPRAQADDGAIFDVAETLIDEIPDGAPPRSPIRVSDDVGSKGERQRIEEGTNDPNGGAEQPDGDDLDALLMETTGDSISKRSSLFGNGQGQTTSQRGQGRAAEDMFADEMEAMQNMEPMW